MPRPARERSDPFARARRPARRQHSLGPVLYAVPDGDGARRGMLPRRRGRSPLRRLLRRVHGRTVRPFRAAHPGRPARRYRSGPQSRVGRGTGRPAGGAALRALSVARARALHQQRHRGQHDGAWRRAGLLRSPRHSCLQRRLPRRIADASVGGGSPINAPIPVTLARLQRHGADYRGSSHACRRDRRRHPRAHDGLGRLHTGNAGIPGRAARGHPRSGHPADLR